MNDQDIITILQEHKCKEQVILQKANDCKDFWNTFTHDVFMTIPADDNSTDVKVRSSLEDFAEIDTLEVVNKKGKLLKRFSYFWKDQQGYKLDDKIMGIIGDLLQRHLSNTANTFTYDFTNVIDWNDGKFGKSGSCWWGQYSESRETFTDNGGWGIRFYRDMNDDEGIGRTWIIPHDGMILGFNSYGVSRAQTSKVIKSIFAGHGIKLHYKQVSIENSQNSEIPYINGDSGFVLYADDMNPDNVPDGFDLDMEVESDDRPQCTVCGERLDTEYGDYEYIDDDYYCPDCAYSRFSNCEKCGEWYDKDDIHEVSGHPHYSYLCEYCAKREDYVECYECNKYVRDYLKDSDGDTFCEDCAEEHLTFCEECDEYFYGNGHTHEAPDTSGLTVSQETLHAQLRIDGDIQENHENVTVYRVDGISGLSLFNPHSINSKLDNSWNISHDTSGLAVKSEIEKFSTAKELLIRLSSLTDWSRDAKELSADRELMSTTSNIIREVLG